MARATRETSMMGRWNAHRDPMPRCLASLITTSIAFPHPSEAKEPAWCRDDPLKGPLCPKEKYIDSKALAKEFPSMVGASIKAAVLKGCTTASRRPREERMLRTHDLREAAIELTAPGSHLKQMMESLYM